MRALATIMLCYGGLVAPTLAQELRLEQDTTSFLVRHVPHVVEGYYAQDLGRYKWDYRTEVVNRLHEPLQITDFGIYVYENESWRKINLDDRVYTGEDFSQWYADGDTVLNGWIPPGGVAVNADNWNMWNSPMIPPVKWAFNAVDTEGNTHYAEATLELHPAPVSLLHGGFIPPATYTFKVGDDTTWAQPDFDDSLWMQGQNGTFPAELERSNGWLRLVLLVDTTLWNEPVGLTASLTGAAEIYIDGRLLHRFGQVGTSSEEEQAVSGNSSPTMFSFRPNSHVVAGRSRHVVATRYSSFFLDSPEWTGIGAGFGFNIGDPGAMVEGQAAYNQRVAVNRVVLTTTFLVFAVVHFLLFLFYPAMRSNLYAATMGVSAGLFAYFNFESEFAMWSFVQDWIWHERAAGIAASFTYVSMLRFTHELLYPRVTKIFIALTALACAFVAWIWFNPFSTSAFGALIGIVFCLEILRSIVAARVHRRKFRLEGSWIMLLGMVPVALVSVHAFLAVDLEWVRPLRIFEPLETPYYAGVVGMLFISVFLGYNFSRVNKALTASNAALEDYSQTLEDKVEVRTAELQQAMHDLTHAQDKLIHSEKMASLGQLTAGIAHEIKNPLNFVNNFARLNAELADDIEQYLQYRQRHRKASHEVSDPPLASPVHTDDTPPDANGAVPQRIPSIDEALEAITALKSNAETIIKHGERADGIVSSMLDHSRETTGETRTTELNAFVEEYLVLTYHAMRAQQPEFDVVMERNYDKRVGTIEVVPQELGRVLLNLFNNAFDAVYERAQSAKSTATPATPYVPTVTASTRLNAEGIAICIRDNGPGIQAAQQHKIFEPFFTTKATGQGNTGLGLSLSFDIVTHGLGGTLEVESNDGDGAVFVITLPS